jgi:tripartite-type tricarboxylate transporter receptor subunit TctC
MFARGARALALSFAALALAAPAMAQWKPTKPVDLIVHTGPGGGSDLLARAMVTMIEKEKLVPVRINVLNKPGGNGARRGRRPLREEGRPAHHRPHHQRVDRGSADFGGGEDHRA